MKKYRENFLDKDTLKEILNRVSFTDSVIDYNGMHMEINGVYLNYENKKYVWNILTFFSKIYSSLSISNLPLNLDDAIIIQKVFLPQINSISFKNCPFIFSIDSYYHFDFSQLKNLNNFQCSDCFCTKCNGYTKNNPAREFVVFGYFKKLHATEQ